MRIIDGTLLLALLTVSAAAQQRSVGPTPSANNTPRLDISLGFNHMQANAPPGVSDDFGLNGGFAGAAFHFNNWIALVGEVTGGHASDISTLGQDLNLTTYLAGPRFTYGRHRVVPFGEALFGGAHGSDSYFPTGGSYSTSASSFAYSAGGGFDVNLSHRIAVRPVEAQFLHTGFANGSSNTQRHLTIGVGIVLKFGGHQELPPTTASVAAVVTRPRGDIHFTCSINSARVTAGQDLSILGNTSTEPDHLEVMYTWMPQAGMIEGSGREVKLNTDQLQPGHYYIRGHAAVTGDYTLAADCDLPFDIIAPVVPVVTAAVPPPAQNQEAVSRKQKDFHTNVPDAYFDYNNAVLRSDAQIATLHAAEFLNAHPEMQVRVEGFADERGSVEYNLMLGQQRAQAARTALIKAGVAAGRVEIISFGKADPVCKESVESCYEQNRRAAFSLHP